MPGSPIGANTGKPAAPASRYTTMLATPADGPSQSPASATMSGCSVIGTCVPGTGMAICDAAASAAAKPTMPASVTQPEREGMDNVVMILVDSVHASDAERDGISAAQTQCGESRLRPTILHRVEEGREHARAARADRMA